MTSGSKQGVLALGRRSLRPSRETKGEVTTATIRRWEAGDSARWMSCSQENLGKLRGRQARGGSSESPCSPVAAVGPCRGCLGSARPQVPLRGPAWLIQRGGAGLERRGEDGWERRVPRDWPGWPLWAPGDTRVPPRGAGAATAGSGNKWAAVGAARAPWPRLWLSPVSGWCSARCERELAAVTPGNNPKKLGGFVQVPKLRAASWKEPCSGNFQVSAAIAFHTSFSTKG